MAPAAPEVVNALSLMTTASFQYKGRIARLGIAWVRLFTSVFIVEGDGGRLGFVRDRDIDDARNSREALLYDIRASRAVPVPHREGHCHFTREGRRGEPPSARVIQTSILAMGRFFTI
jgi:hypothetical protein